MAKFFFADGGKTAINLDLVSSVDFYSNGAKLNFAVVDPQWLKPGSSSSKPLVSISLSEEDAKSLSEFISD